MAAFYQTHRMSSTYCDAAPYHFGPGRRKSQSLTVFASCCRFDHKQHAVAACSSVSQGLTVLELRGLPAAPPTMGWALSTASLKVSRFADCQCSPALSAATFSNTRRWSPTWPVGLGDWKTGSARSVHPPPVLSCQGREASSSANLAMNGERQERVLAKPNHPNTRGLGEIALDDFSRRLNMAVSTVHVPQAN